jgi:hypothetical protein
MSTLSAMRTRVASHVGSRTDKNTQIDLFLNMAQADLGNRHDFGELKTTDSTGALAITDYTEALPATIRKVERVTIKDASSNYWTPDLIGKDEFRAMWPEVIPQTSGPSSECFIENRTIYFSHKADVAYTIYLDGVKYTTDMSGDSDTPTLTGMDDILIAQATGYLYAHLKQPDMAGFRKT